MQRVTKAPDWQRRRARLNHDWLRNQFLVHLDGLSELIESSSWDDEFVDEFAGSILPRWEVQHENMRDLIDRFEDEMSPRTLFESTPLSRCRLQSNGWLEELVHILWLARYPVSKWIADAHRSAGQANEAYARLRDVLKSSLAGSLTEHLRENRPLLTEFREKCERLSEAIGRFPHRVLVT